ncbi:MAG: HAMP domain-containing sensor histidine kinase [Chloroflexota bacterium]|nr:HAMP domain-containing sensor histidine kinase [Chloroflexota bacterium]
MFHSIRWRLVASYVLLTLLTVSLVGVLALSLIKQYVEQQEQDYLTANAEAVAHQALPLMQPAIQRPDLQELASTASFLGNIQVRILDDHQRVLADSGHSGSMNGFVWLTVPARVRVLTTGRPSVAPIMILPFDHRSLEELPQGELLAIFEQLPAGTEGTVVYRVEGLGGSRFSFGDTWELEVMPAFPMTDGLPLHETIEKGRVIPSSEHTVTAPIGEANRPIGHVELSKGTGFATEALTTARRAFLLAGGGATLLAVAVGLLVSRGLTAPLRSLTTVAGQMSSGDLSIRAPVPGKDEIGRLAQQFNLMAERLEASFAELAAERDSLRHFITDASHELRTPITALKSFNELLQGAAANDPKASAEFLAESQAQLDRLEWITHNLLDLSRLDAGLITLDMANHDVGEMIETAASAFKTLAQEKNIQLSVKPPSPPLGTRCNRARIELALSNLLDNALKFTLTGGHVEIGAEQAGQSVYLWVKDDGPGIPLEEQEHIFERFYRIRDSHVAGSGLGLTIVRSITQAHGGNVTVESEPGIGSRFAIELSLSESEDRPQ